ETPLQLLVATILASQCSDERVNSVTPALFARYRTAADFAGAKAEELEELIKPTGFFRNKAAAIQSVCRELVARFRGEVPRTMEELTTLDRVARKTANIVLVNAFRIPSGIAVDSHVVRVAHRLGLTAKRTEEAIESDLCKLVPREQWIQFGLGAV